MYLNLDLSVQPIYSFKFTNMILRESKSQAAANLDWELEDAFKQTLKLDRVYVSHIHAQRDMILISSIQLHEHEHATDIIHIVSMALEHS